MPLSVFAGKRVVVTGGTGSFGQAFARRLLAFHSPGCISIFSRDEWKQSEMARDLPRSEYPSLRYRLGDVRDYQRLLEVFRDTDIVIHAAAQKQVPASEYNPFEAVSSNVIGTQNVVRAAIERGVKRVIFLSTDKAVDPINLYGASKMCAEKLVIAANIMSGQKTKCSVVRYGNVFGSRGSVIPLWLEQRKSGIITLTDGSATRFWLPLCDAVDLVCHAAQYTLGGEVFIPKVRASSMSLLAEVVANGWAEVGEIGMRPGEKHHETLVSKLDDGTVVDLGYAYAVLPRHYWYDPSMKAKWGMKQMQPRALNLTSDNPDIQMSREELEQLLAQYLEGRL